VNQKCTTTYHFHEIGISPAKYISYIFTDYLIQSQSPQLWTVQLSDRSSIPDSGKIFFSLVHRVQGRPEDHKSPNRLLQGTERPGRVKLTFHTLYCRDYVRVEQYLYSNIRIHTDVLIKLRNDTIRFNCAYNSTSFTVSQVIKELITRNPKIPVIIPRTGTFMAQQAD
jgi:hypothetical protein